MLNIVTPSRTRSNVSGTLTPRPGRNGRPQCRQIRHEGFRYHLAEQGLLLAGEVLQASLETKASGASTQGICNAQLATWMNMSAAGSCTVPTLTSGDVLNRLLYLPAFGIKEPRLIGRNQHRGVH